MDTVRRHHIFPVPDGIATPSSLARYLLPSRAELQLASLRCNVPASMVALYGPEHGWSSAAGFHAHRVGAVGVQRLCRASNAGSYPLVPSRTGARCLATANSTRAGCQ